MTDQPADLSDVAAALRELAAALRPALTPAMRPTWDQQRWAPGPGAFGAEVAPAAAVDAAGWPTHVVADELIESAWGNAVVDGLAGVRVDGGVNNIAAHVTTPGVVLNTSVGPVKSYSTRMFVTATVGVSSDSAAMTGVSAGIITDVAGTNGPNTNLTGDPTVGSWVYVPLVWSWTVPAGGSAQYAISVNWGGGVGGTKYSDAVTTWQRYRQ